MVEVLHLEDEAHRSFVCQICCEWWESHSYVVGLWCCVGLLDRVIARPFFVEQTALLYGDHKFFKIMAHVYDLSPRDYFPRRKAAPRVAV